jgi:1-acyl-sn-glycerol-3-phosphate acyltransferase
VALDSGKVWRRNSFLKRAGTITIQFLPPIPPPDPSMGRVDKKHFMQTLQDKIEQACQSL